MPRIDLFFKVFFTGLLAALGFGITIDAVCYIISPDYFWQIDHANSFFSDTYLSFMAASISKFCWMGVLIGYAFGMAALMPDVDAKRLRLIYKSIGFVFLAIALVFGVSLPVTEYYWDVACCDENLSMKFVDGIQLFIQDNAKVGILAGVAHYVVFFIKQDYQKQFSWGR